MRHYDPYDFSDCSDDEEDMQTDENQHEDRGVDIEIDASDSGSASSHSDNGTGSATLYTASTASCSEASTAFSNHGSSSSYDEELRDDDSDDDGMSSDGSLSTWTFRHEYGRGLAASSDVYRLPADEEERHRLRKQHHMLIDIMGAKYPPRMERVLASTTPGEKRVLDIGCGNGEWIRDVARDFPLCECLAIDLVPIREWVKDYQLLIEHVSRILRPGGLMELAEFDFSIYDKHRNQIPVLLHEPMAPPYWPRWMAHLHQAVKKGGGDVLAAVYLWQWTTSHPAFDNIEYRDVWIPTIPGNDTAFSGETYALLRENVASFLRSGKPLICRSGVSEEDFEFLRDQTLWELHHSQETQYTRLQTLWALKRMDYVAPPDEA